VGFSPPEKSLPTRTVPASSRRFTAGCPDGIGGAQKQHAAASINSAGDELSVWIDVRDERHPPPSIPHGPGPLGWMALKNTVPPRSVKPQDKELAPPGTISAKSDVA
jgi:hypothetical protein